MKQIIQNITPIYDSLFFCKNDANDLRLGEIVKNTCYQDCEIVILGCPQDEGVRRNGGRIGAALAPDLIREQFYKLTNFGINAKIFDAGNTKIKGSLEEIHERQTETVKQLLSDDKTLIILGGGNDISYPDCRALSEIFGAENILALNIDAHFDVRADEIRNSGTPYRQLLEEKLVLPVNFFEVGWQKQLNSQTYHQYLKDLSVNLTGFEELDLKIFKEKMEAVLNSQSFAVERKIFWGFDVDAVCAKDAPGVSASNPLGLSAKEFVQLAEFAGVKENSKIIEFTEMNPKYDIDSRTAKLVAAAMHKFCASRK
jgi:formiminoglutamase